MTANVIPPAPVALSFLVDAMNNELAPVEQSTEVAQEIPEVAAPETLQPGTEQTPEPVKDEGKAAREAMQRRINRVTADKYQLKAERDQLAKELEQFRTQQPATGEQPQPQIPRDLIEREAKRIASESKFLDQCNAIADKWREESAKDFPAQFTALTDITGPLINDTGGAEPLLQAVMTTDAPHKVLAHLALNPDIAATLVDLTPIQQARKLALIEQSMSTKPIRQPSAAPRPLEPVGTQATAGEPNPRDTERWIAWRNKQVAKK